MNKLFNLDFQDVGDYNSPKDIIEEQCEHLSDATNALVLGRVQDYSGEIQNYIKPGAKSPMKALTAIWEDQEDEEIEIQSQLGELSDGVFTYDFFITSKYTPNYKYRVMFFRYGIGAYPVKVVMDEIIANEIGKESDIICKTENNFIEYLTSVLTSKRFTEIVRNLYSYNKKNDVDNLPF